MTGGTPASPGPLAPKAEEPRPGEYVLGTNERERARLGLQQEVWGHVTEAFLDRLRVPVGGRVLDLGCGPGFVVESLRRRVGPAGRVDALDESPVWHEHLRRESARRGWENVRLIQSKVEAAPLEDGAYDLIFGRWVMEFLPDVRGVLGRLARALRPGGAIAAQDYNHEGISVFPVSEGFRAVVRATRAMWASRGGDMFLAPKLPGWMRAIGLEVVDETPTVLCGGPQSGVARWMDSFFPAHSSRMVEAGLLAPAERELFLREWPALFADPDARFFSPIVVDVAARRPR